MKRDVLYCDECGGRLNLYVVGVCSRCHFDLTGEDEDSGRREPEAPPRVEGPAE